MEQNFFEIETERLRLRRFHDDDLHYFFQYRSNPTVAKYQGWENYTIDQAKEFVAKQKIVKANIPGSWVQIAIEQKENGRLIGDFGLHTLNEPLNAVEIGFTLDPSYQHKGYATEALTKLIDYLFNELHKEKMKAIVVEQNFASIKLLERMGFKRIEIIQNSYFKGQYVTEYEFELTNKEWNRVGDELQK